MSQHDKYLTFPIAFLQLGKALDDVTQKEAADRIRAIIPWCIREATLQNLRDLDGDTGKLLAIAERNPNFDETEGTDVDIAFFAAIETLGWNVMHFEYAQHAASKLETSVAMSEGKKLSRVRRDIVFQAMNGGMKWRYFAILASIFAGCFDPKKRKAVPLTMEQIGAMSLGYKSAKCVHANAAEEFSISEKAIGRTVEKLRKRGFYVKASPSRGRTTYYSNSMSEEQMICYVSEVKKSRMKKRKECRSMSEIQREVNARANALSGLTPEQRIALEDINARLKERRRNSDQG